MRNNIYENLYVEKVNSFNTALVDGDFPASGSYIDVSSFTHFAFLVAAGTLNSELTLQVQQAEAVDGSTANITSATATIAADDDNQWGVIEVEVAKMNLATDRYVTLDVAGAAGGDDYACIFFIGWNVRHAPVTQSANFSFHTLIAG